MPYIERDLMTLPGAVLRTLPRRIYGILLFFFITLKPRVE